MKVVFQWDWYQNVFLTLNKPYRVLDIKIDRSVKEYLIEDDSGEKRWYKSYLFEDISEVRDSKLKELLGIPNN